MSPDGRAYLLAEARSCIAHALGVAAPHARAPNAEVVVPAGCFVTLRRRDGELRGCIGTFNATASLADNVRQMAVAAASRDPRFPPLAAHELDQCVIEISALGKKQPATAADVQIGEHGVWIERGTRRGVLLPQVATDHGWDRETFLEHTCLKAGLPADAWRHADTRLSVFAAEVFTEAT